MASEDRGRADADAEDLRDRLLGRLESLPRFDHLVFAILYGSRGPGGEPGPASDVDVCLHYDLPEDEVQDLSLEVAGAFPDPYDVRFFQLLPLQVRREVLGGEVLYARHRDEVYDAAIETLRAWQDYGPRYRMVIA